jgi:hypothetical protein
MSAWGQIVSEFSKPVTRAKASRTFAMEKRCTKCGEIKHRNQFYARTDHSPGALMSQCKICCSALQVKRRESRKKAEANMKAKREDLNNIPAAKFEWPDD